MNTKLGDRQRDLVDGFAAELAAVVGALLGGAASATPAPGPVPPGWTVACGLTGAMAGRLTLTVGHADAMTLARRLMGMPDDPPDEAVADTVAEVAGQAAGGLSQRSVAGGAKIRVEGAPAREGMVPPETVTIFDVKMEDGTVLRFGCWAQLEQTPDIQPGPNAVSASAAASSTSSAQASKASATAPPDNLDVILDIELPLTVRFGRTEMTLQSLTKVGPGSVIDLDRSPDEPVDVLINDKVIARGEVVVVSGNYGVRITEVASAAERIRTMG